MTWDDVERQRRMRNYSIMLKAALVCLACAVVTVTVGGIRAVALGDPVWLIYGMFFLIWSIGSAYLTVDSTVRVIDGDTKNSAKRSS